MKFIVLFVAIVAFAASAPTDIVNPEEAGEVEGDMIFDSFRSAIRGRRWSAKTLVYRFDSALGSTQRSRAASAVTILNNALKGCITVRAYRSGDNVTPVTIRNGNGCSASVGYSSRNVMNLSSRCGVGNIVHEFLHNLGFFHEQSRSDRDKWVKIHFENIRSGLSGNFRKYTTSNSDNLGEDYDYGSIMHYPARAFSTNGQNTITPLKSLGGKRMGQRSGLSAADVRKVKKAYGC